MDVAMISVANTNIEKREKVNFTDFKRIEFQAILQHHHIEQCVIVSTCNRSEVYAFGKSEHLVKLKDLYMSFFVIDDKDIVYLQDVFAIQHILQVACGLKSTILGEDQIFKQVKEAYQFACVHQIMHKQVHFIFQHIFRIVKQIKRTYRLSEHPRSTAYVAMKLLKEQVALEHASYLLCGGGEIIKQCLPYIAKAKTIYVAMRDLQKMQSLKKIAANIQAIPFEERYDYLCKVDVLLSATSSPHLVFERDKMTIGEKQQWILDLALPRDVQETIAQYPNLHMWNIDDVQCVVKYHEQSKHSICYDIDACIWEKAQELYEKSRQVVFYQRKEYRKYIQKRVRKEDLYEV